MQKRHRERERDSADDDLQITLVTFINTKIGLKIYIFCTFPFCLDFLRLSGLFIADFIWLFMELNDWMWMEHEFYKNGD